MWHGEEIGSEEFKTLKAGKMKMIQGRLVPATQFTMEPEYSPSERATLEFYGAL
jgi:hypothetical protein